MGGWMGNDSVGSDTSGGSAAGFEARGGNNPGFGTGGGGSVGGGGGYGGNSPNQSNPGGNPNRNNDRDYRDQGRGNNVTSNNPQPPSVTAVQNQDRSAIPSIGFPGIPGMPGGTTMWSPTGAATQITPNTIGIPTIVGENPLTPPSFQSSPYRIDKLSPTSYQQDANEAYKQKMGYVESKNQGSAYNMSSGAFGKFQFLGSTAVGLMKKNYPDMVAGMTDDQILRSVALNQGLQDTLIDDFNKANEIALKNSGIAVNDTNKYMAHWFGAGGADNILSAPPSTPIENILSPEAIKNNRLTGMTTGEVAAKAASVMANAGKAVTQNALEAGSANKYATNENPAFMTDATEIDGLRVSTVSPDVVEAVKNKTFGQYLDDTLKKYVQNPIDNLFKMGYDPVEDQKQYNRDRSLSQEEMNIDRFNRLHPEANSDKEKYGGRDSSGIASLGKANNNQAPEAQQTETSTQSPQVPVYTTGIDTAIRDYVGGRTDPNYYPYSAYS